MSGSSSSCHVGHDASIAFVLMLLFYLSGTTMSHSASLPFYQGGMILGTWPPSTLPTSGTLPCSQHWTLLGLVSIGM